MKVVHTSGLRHATITGHVILLEPGIETELPDFLGVLALGLGAKQVVAEGEIEIDPASVKQEAAPKETRHQKLVRIMSQIVALGDPANFRQDGQPKVSVLNRLFGEAVLEEEREAAWKEATTKY
jgi:hypothetical protein